LSQENLDGSREAIEKGNNPKIKCRQTKIAGSHRPGRINFATRNGQLLPKNGERSLAIGLKLKPSNNPN